MKREEKLMNETSRKEQLELFRNWIMTRTSPEYQLYQKENDQDTIVLETDYCRGEVSFYPKEIIQLSVLNTRTDRHEFFLHFQIHTLEHACNLFEEMREAIIELANKPTARILLCCTSGLTTGFFAAKLNESAQLLSLDYDFHAVPYRELFQVGGQYDIVLLAPQIFYAYEDIKKILPDQVVLKIPPKIFAAYDAGKLLQEISPYLVRENQKKVPEEDMRQKPQPLLLKQDIHVDVSTLVIALINEKGRQFHYAYRVYDKANHVLYDGDMFKRHLALTDLYDICDTVFVHFPEIDMIGLAMPGIIDGGKVTFVSQNIYDLDVVDMLSRKYQKRVVLENDANSIAIGYYASQDKYSSISLIFQPTIGHPGGVGTICNGQIIAGLHHVAGEVQYLPMYRNPELAPLWKTPEGAVQLATQIMAIIISLLGPEMIILSSQLIIHADSLVKKLEEYIPRAYIPEVVLITNVREYMLLGMMVTCAMTLE